MNQLINVNTIVLSVDFIFVACIINDINYTQVFHNFSYKRNVLQSWIALTASFPKQ